MTAEFYALKGMLQAQIGKNDEANKAFSAAVQMRCSAVCGPKKTVASPRASPSAHSSVKSTSVVRSHQPGRRSASANPWPEGAGCQIAGLGSPRSEEGKHLTRLETHIGSVGFCFV